jgi:hypothetical protein
MSFTPELLAMCSQIFVGVLALSSLNLGFAELEYWGL